MGDQVRPGTSMFHTKMISIPFEEHERLKEIERAYYDLKLKYDTLLHEGDQDAS